MPSLKEKKIENLPENKYKSNLGTNKSFLENSNERMSLEITFLVSSIIICIVVSLISIVTQGKNQIRVNCSDPTHIVVMTHGWAGTPANMDVLAERILNKYSILINNEWSKNQQIKKSECILIYKVHSNWGYFRSIFITSDGIENGALRMSKEIQEVIIKTPSLEKISFIGHSLGGLYNRAVLPLLSDSSLGKQKNQSGNNKGLIGGLKPMNFISIGTPHKGVLSDNCTFFGFEVLKMLFPWRWISRLPTISQLLMMDKNGPLIADMMNNMNMINPLSWFKHRHTVGSIKGDLLVPPTSASLLPFCIDNEGFSLLSFNNYEFSRRYQTDNIYKFNNFKQNYQFSSKIIKNYLNFVPNNKVKDGEENLIEWITVIDSGNEKTYENKNELYYRNMKNRRKLINLVKEKYQNKFLNQKTLDDVINKNTNGNLDKLVWMKTSVLFKNKIHRFFSHQLMMFCFENWGYFLLGNNFQLLDHIIENMRF
ncbi:uncharacterized protein cubi_01347 [Cryptosporidium ubiquitum]|uniref:DUF676 domain-containing protein n=1 Tax=Cryptosporidium ubiquitum TaxID=857276 RepID=A0A1J4MCR9_9CRYT|nr:uncharacterized protein cubi_01347 [Cryptosporidium ubiquitum]OII72014.1 hypothetical protein cubi_01347 [Cryptosporidium ubiquitum]